VDSLLVPGDVAGWYSSLTLDGEGHPHISYRVKENASAGNLRYDTYECSAWQIMTVDMGATPTDDVGYYTSIALAGDGSAHISYYDATHGVLRYSFYDGSSWVVGIDVDRGDNSGQYNAVALDASGMYALPTTRAPPTT